MTECVHSVCLIVGLKCQLPTTYNLLRKESQLRNYPDEVGMSLGRVLIVN